MTDLIKHYRQLVCIAKTWAMKTQPGWSDDSHRDILVLHGAVMIDGRISASSLNVPQLDAVLSDYERRGWSRNRRVFSGSGQAQKVPEGIAHIVRLWAKLEQAGKLTKDSSRTAMLAFCANQIKRDSLKNLDDLTTKERQQIIEALKAWLARDAVRPSLTPSLSHKRGEQTRES